MAPSIDVCWRVLGSTREGGGGGGAHVHTTPHHTHPRMRAHARTHETTHHTTLHPPAHAHTTPHTYTHHTHAHTQLLDGAGLSAGLVGVRGGHRSCGAAAAPPLLPQGGVPAVPPPAPPRGLQQRAARPRVGARAGPRAGTSSSLSSCCFSCRGRSIAAMAAIAVVLCRGTWRNAFVKSM
jgi:hypothetical protein